MPGFLQKEINLDVGHVILIVAALVVVWWLMCRYGSEGLDVPKIVARSCHCPSCADVAYDKLKNDQYYSCRKDNPNEPYSKENCYKQYKDALLFGCGIA